MLTRLSVPVPWPIHPTLLPHTQPAFYTPYFHPISQVRACVCQDVVCSLTRPLTVCYTRFTGAIFSSIHLNLARSSPTTSNPFPSCTRVVTLTLPVWTVEINRLFHPITNLARRSTTYYLASFLLSVALSERQYHLEILTIPCFYSDQLP